MSSKAEMGGMTDLQMLERILKNVKYTKNEDLDHWIKWYGGEVGTSIFIKDYVNKKKAMSFISPCSTWLFNKSGTLIAIVHYEE